MTAAKLDPALCRKLASLARNLVPTLSEREDIAAQLSAAADLAERPALTEDRVREVVARAVRATPSSNYETDDERVYAITDRAAKELAGAVVGLGAEEVDTLLWMRGQHELYVEAARHEKRSATNTTRAGMAIALVDRLLLAAAFDRAAVAITDQPAAELADPMSAPNVAARRIEELEDAMCTAIDALTVGIPAPEIIDRLQVVLDDDDRRPAAELTAQLDAEDDPEVQRLAGIAFTQIASRTAQPIPVTPATASIGPDDTAIIDRALAYLASRETLPGHSLRADIDRIRALLASPGGGS